MRARHTWPSIVFAACCGCGDGDAPKARPLDFAAMSDSAKVLLIDEIPIGFTAMQVRERIPALPPLRQYGSDHLQQTALAVSVFDRSTNLTFNFADSVLYGYYYGGPLCWPKADADSMFELISRIYSSRHGQFEHDEGADHPYYVVSRQWRQPGSEAGVTMSLQGDSNCLGWGYQRPTP